MNIKKLKNRFIPMSETMFYILLSLQTPRHGYGIMQHVKEITNSRIILGAGTVYSSLKKLDNSKLIQSVSEENRRKIYIMTEIGRLILHEEALRIKELYQNVEGLL